MPTFTAVVTSHANTLGLTHILGNLYYQTRKPDEVIVLASDTPDSYLAGIDKDFSPLFDRFSVLACPNMEDWGHEKRAQGIGLAASDYLGFFNDDDRYDSTYVERMMLAADKAAVVYCAWNEQPECGFHTGSSTAGNFIVATDLARDVGYRERSYPADGHFISAITQKNPMLARVDDVLYFHNEGVLCR